MAYDGKVDCDYSQSLAETAFCCPLYNVQITAGVMWHPPRLPCRDNR